MKLNGSLFLILSSALLYPSLFSHARQQLQGLVEVPASLEKTPEFSILFAGQHTYSSPEGFFSFSVDGPLYSLSLLVCEEVQIAFAQKDHKVRNTIDGLMVDTKQPHYFARLFGNADGSVSWRTVAFDGAVPADCMVILAKPDMVKHVERLALDSSLGVIAGPKIVLEGARKSIQSSSMKSLASSADILRFFKSTPFLETWQANTKLSTLS